MPNLLALRTSVRDATGFDVSDPLHSDATITSHLNAALRKVDNLGDPWWLMGETTTPLVAGQADYPLAESVTRVRYVMVSRNERATRLEVVRRADTASPTFNATGAAPTDYSADAGNVTLYPAPGAAALPADLLVGVVISEVALVVDTDTPLMPERYHDALVMYAAMRASLRSGSSAELIKALRAEADDWLMLVQRDMRRSLASPAVRITREWT